jgi:hypothetical protein
MSVSPRLLHVLLPAAAITVLAGCAPLNLKNPLPWPAAPEDKPGVPDRVTAIWTDTVLYHPDRPPERGFGGRLLFYGAKEKPIKVDGTLVVYAFDETSRSPSNAKPDRKYVFPKELLAKHYSECGMGHSYSFWIPWDQVGGEQKELSLIARFLPAAGAPVIGQMTKHLLPGVPPQAAAANAQLSPPGGAAAAGQGQVYPVSYEAPTAAAQTEGAMRNDPPQRMTTTTIDIPGQFGRQLPVATPKAQSSRAAMSGWATPSSALTASPAAAWQAGPAMEPLPARQVPPRRQAHFAPAKSPAPAAQSALPRPDRSPWTQPPVTSLSGPGPGPLPATGVGPAATVTGVAPAYY